MKKIILLLTLLGFVFGPLTPQTHAAPAKDGHEIEWHKKHHKHRKHKKRGKHHKKHRKHRKHGRKHTA